MNYLYTNILGSFVLDDGPNILDSGDEKKLQRKHKALQQLPKEKLLPTLMLFKDQRYHYEFYKKNIKLTQLAIKESVTEDQLIIQAISNINELDKVCNVLAKRLREWYSHYFPELSELLVNHERFVELVATETKESLLKKEKIKSTMGADIGKIHIDEITNLARKIGQLYQLRREHEEYLRKVMLKYCPNLLELAGVTIGARLIELAKGLKRLALLPASTVQLLGAEKALFRHLKTGSKSPKYGVIISHPLIQNAGKKQKGKASRMLADKLSLCARLDFFKGEFKAKEYRKQLEEKLNETNDGTKENRKKSRE